MTDKPVPAEVLMSEAEAAAITEEFKATVEEFEGVGIRVQAVALRAQQGGAWKVRKFKSWAEYVEKEIGWSKRHANRMVRAAQFAGELEAASGTRVPPLTERETRSLSTEQRAEVVAEVKEATVGLPKKKREKVAAEVIQKATANFKSEQVVCNLAGDALTRLVDLAVAAGVTRDAMATQILRSVLETGEVPSLPAANGRKARAPTRAPAMEAAMARQGVATIPRQSNVAADGHKHIATKAKQGASGMVRCDVCGIPKVGTRWVEP